MWPFKKKYPTLDLSKVADANDALRYTYDAPLLETQRRWLVFVYDGFQMHHPLHKKIVELGALNMNKDVNRDDPVHGYTVSRMVLWKHMGKRVFPVPLYGVHKHFQNRPKWDLTGGQGFAVKGQLFSLDWKGIAELDEFYKNGVEYQRHRVHVLIPYHYELEDTDGRISTSLRHETIINAYMYVGVQSYWDEHLDGSFAPVKVFPPKRGNPPYYWFTNLEYKTR